MSTDFGNDSGDGESTLSNSVRMNDGVNTIWTCPGSGLQNVDYLKAYVRRSTSGSANFLLAIYDTSNNFIMQGSAEINVTETSLLWKSHTSFVDQYGTPISTPQLTGGNDYKLVASGDGTNLKIYRSTVTSGYAQLINIDFTGGYPATLESIGAVTSLPCILCGVTAAASGLSIPVVQSVQSFFKA